MIRMLISLLLITLATSASAIKCYITIAKDNCWMDYNVTVNVLDASNDNKLLATVIIPEGSAWARQPFVCQPKQELKLQAQFTPVFWQDDVGKVYDGLQYWTLPEKVGAGETVWNINVCYPKQFSEVPLPPQATSNCVCDFSKIPAPNP